MLTNQTMQTEAPIHRPTHRPRVLSVASATPPAPAVPTKSNLRRSLLGPISSTSSSSSELAIPALPEKTTAFLQEPTTPVLPLKSPNRPSFRIRGNPLQLGSGEFNDNPLLHKSSGSIHNSEDSEVELDLTDGVSSGTQLYDSEREYQPAGYPDTPKDSPPNQNSSLESLTEQTKRNPGNSFGTRKSSFLEARKKFLGSPQDDTSPPSLNQASLVTKVYDSPGNIIPIKTKVASFESNTSSISTDSYSTIRERDAIRTTNAVNSFCRDSSGDCTPRAAILETQIKDSPKLATMIYQEPEPISRAINKDNLTDYDEGVTILEISKKIDTSSSRITATIKEAEEEIPDQNNFAIQESEKLPDSSEPNDHSDLEGEVEICTIKKAEACTQILNGVSASISRNSVDEKESPNPHCLPDSIYHDAVPETRSCTDTQSSVEMDQSSVEAVHLQLTKLSKPPSESGQDNLTEFDGFQESLVSSPPSLSHDQNTDDSKSPSNEPNVSLPQELRKSASDNTHRNKTSSSMMSWSSQDSAHSEGGGIMGKVRNLYDLLQTRSKTPTGKSSARPRGMSDSQSQAVPAVQVSKGPELKNFQYQNISNMVRRLSLMDITPPTDTRAASLYSVEELDADNVDWEFWGQLVNNFESMSKNNYAVLQRSVRQGVPVSMRGMVWQLLAEIRGTGLMDVYAQLLTRTSPHEKSITADLPRTFPQLAFFKSRDGTGQESLFNVLKCYSLYDPEVGYCQGLSFLAGPLLLNMPDEEAFCVLVRMMEGLRLHFTPAMEGLQVRTYQFERMMEDSLPQVYRHLQEQGIQSTMYASQWFMTMFAYRSSMRLVFRVLDILLLEGGDFLVKVALALLKDNVDQILSRRFDDLIAYLKSGIFDHYQDRTDHLIAMACDQKLSERRMGKWRREYMAEIAKKAEDEAYAASLQGVNEQLAESNKGLNYQLHQLGLANQDLSQQLVTYQDALATQSDRNAALEHRLNEMEALLHTERQRAEAVLLDQMDTLAQKNLSLVTKNAALEDALAQAEDTIISLRAALSSRP